MKRLFSLLIGIWVLATLVGCGSAAVAQKGYNMEFTVNGFSESEAYLAYYYGDKQYIRDTAEAVNGSFAFVGDTSLEGGIYLVVFPPLNDYFEIIVDEDQTFKMTTDTSDYVRNMKVKGSNENELFYGDLNYLADMREKANEVNQKLQAAAKGSSEEADLKKQQQDINNEVQAYREKFMEDNPEFLFTKVLKAMQDPQVPEAPKDENGNQIDSLFAFKYYKKHYFDGLDFQDDRLLRTPVMFNRVNTYMDRLTYKYIPDSVIKSVDYILGAAEGNDDVFQFFTVHFLNNYADREKGGKIMGMDAVYVHMVEQYYMNPDRTPWVDSASRAKMIERATAMSQVIIGRAAPNFRVKDDAGNYQILSAVPGDWLILYFWDYGCGHCKKVTPRLVDTYKKYGLKDRNVTLMTININGDIEEWKEKLEEYGLNAEGVMNCEDIRRESGSTVFYDITSTPRLFLLDRNKVIKAKQIGVPQMLQIFSRELGIEIDEEDKVEIEFDEEDEE